MQEMIERWEYNVISSNEVDKWEMNGFGEKGWELVSVIHNRHEFIFFYKKPCCGNPRVCACDYFSTTTAP